MTKMTKMTKMVGWKDYECQRCHQEFTRRALETPKLCFHCEWMTSEAKMASDLESFDPSI